jgi:diadenylate cyclase
MSEFFTSIYEFFYTSINLLGAAFASFRISDIIDIGIIAFLLYKLIVLFRDTRSKQIIKGVSVLLIVWIIARLLNLVMLSWMFTKAVDYLIIAAIIVFHPEIRRALEGMGRSNIGRGIFNISTPEEDRQNILAGIDAVCRASSSLQENKTGALIVFERETGLGEIINTGTVLSAEASPSLIGNIFFPNTPLHDGAVVVRGGRIYAAGCYLPLSEKTDIFKGLGTRHRAAIGLSEQSDAVVIVVSEETGTISIAYQGELFREFTSVSLRRKLTELLGKQNEEVEAREEV